MPVAKHRCSQHSAARATALVFALLALGLPAQAGAAPSRANVALVSCTKGDEANTRSATFVATVLRRRGTSQMAVRFSLKKQATAGGDGQMPAALERQAVAVSKWRGWKRSRRGSKSAFSVTRRIDGLSGPADWYVEVAIRWYDRNGTLQTKTTIRSQPCSQPNYASDLEIAAVVLSVAEDPGTGAPGAGAPFVSVTVSNGGRSASQPAELIVRGGGAVLGRAPVPAIAPRKEAPVAAALASCPTGQRLTVTVEQPAGASEVTLANNTSTSLICP